MCGPLPIPEPCERSLTLLETEPVRSFVVRVYDLAHALPTPEEFDAVSDPRTLLATLRTDLLDALLTLGRK